MSCAKVSARKYRARKCRVTRFVVLCAPRPLDARLPLIKKQFQARSTKNKPDFPTVAQDHDLAVYHDVGPIRVYSLESIDDLNTQLEKKIKVYNF